MLYLFCKISPCISTSQSSDRLLLLYTTPKVYFISKVRDGFFIAECECNMTYSNHSICDPRNGQCQCLQSSAGGFYGGRRCTECRWDAVGEISSVHQNWSFVSWENHRTTINHLIYAFLNAGTFPSCAQCNETCYENWYDLIDDERKKVIELSQNVTNVLDTFNGSSVDDINETLAELNTKLAESEKIFDGSRNSTEAKEAQYNKVGTWGSLENLQLDFLSTWLESFFRSLAYPQFLSSERLVCKH